MLTQARLRTHHLLRKRSGRRQPLAADELDRLSVNLSPELVGGGGRLLEEGIPASTWRLDETFPDDTGAIWLYYDRVRKTPGHAGRFTLRRTLDTSLAEAWHAWADSATLRQWWGPTGFACPRADIDLLPAVPRW